MEFSAEFMVDIVKGSVDSDCAALSAFFAKSDQSKPIVIHFHGGLIDGQAAIDAAYPLRDFYGKNGATALIPIWHTGLVEVLETNWVTIASESLFKILLDRVTGWAHARFSDFLTSGRSIGLQRTLPPVDVVNLTASGQGNGDFSEAFLGVKLQGLAGADIELNNADERSLQVSIMRDSELLTEFEAAIRSQQNISEDSRSIVGAEPAAPKPSIADLGSLTESLSEVEGGRAIDWISVAGFVIAIVQKVVTRFAQGADHGLHATVVEEILRKAYISSIGTDVWGAMKNYAKDACDPATPNASGLALLEEIGKLPGDQRVMLVGHSAGAIFIAEILKANKLGKRFEIVLLAPAARMDLFQQIDLTQHAISVTRSGQMPSGVNPAEMAVDLAFRMFTMTDDYESKDYLIQNVAPLPDMPWFYPRSLLYLISGILEAPEVDARLVGMQRFYKSPAYYDQDPDVTCMAGFLKAHSDIVSWSINATGDTKMKANSVHHGGFGAPSPANDTMQSVGNILETGW